MLHIFIQVHNTCRMILYIERNVCNKDHRLYVCYRSNISTKMLVINSIIYGFFINGFIDGSGANVDDSVIENTH